MSDLRDELPFESGGGRAVRDWKRRAEADPDLEIGRECRVGHKIGYVSNKRQGSIDERDPRKNPTAHGPSLPEYFYSDFENAYTAETRAVAYAMFSDGQPLNVINKIVGPSMETIARWIAEGVVNEWFDESALERPDVSRFVDVVANTRKELIVVKRRRKRAGDGTGQLPLRMHDEVSRVPPAVPNLTLVDENYVALPTRRRPSKKYASDEETKARAERLVGYAGAAPDAAAAYLGAAYSTLNSWVHKARKEGRIPQKAPHRPSPSASMDELMAIADELATASPAGLVHDDANTRIAEESLPAIEDTPAPQSAVEEDVPDEAEDVVSGGVEEGDDDASRIVNTEKRLRGSRFPPSYYDRAVRLTYHAGASMREVAAYLGTSYPTITNWIRDAEALGQIPKIVHRRRHGLDLAEIERRFEVGNLEGLSPADVVTKMEDEERDRVSKVASGEQAEDPKVEYDVAPDEEEGKAVIAPDQKAVTPEDVRGVVRPVDLEQSRTGTVSLTLSNSSGLAVTVSIVPGAPIGDALVGALRGVADVMASTGRVHAELSGEGAWSAFHESGTKIVPSGSVVSLVVP